MTETTLSRTGVPIRLTDERWAHIVDEHCELAGLRGEVLETISDAEYVLAGRYNEGCSPSLWRMAGGGR